MLVHYQIIKCIFCGVEQVCTFITNAVNHLPGVVYSVGFKKNCFKSPVMFKHSYWVSGVSGSMSTETLKNDSCAILSVFLIPPRQSIPVSGGL